MKKYFTKEISIISISQMGKTEAQQEEVTYPRQLREPYLSSSAML